jgi:hypothetical protein
MALPTASDNPFPSLLVTEGTAPASPASGKQRVYIDSTSHQLSRKNSSGTVVNLETNQTAAAALIGLKVYAPSSQTISTISGTSMADVDATNMIVTFTAPASGNVLVRLGAYADENSTCEFYWGLREGSTDITTSITRVLREASSLRYISVPMYVTGLGAGSHSLKWSAAVGSNSARIIIQDGSATGKWGPAIMEVWSAP